MARFQACLLDAYGTILSCDFSAHRTELPVLAGIAPEAMDAEFRRLEPAVTDGRLSLSQAYPRIMQACGAEPGPGRVVSVADKSQELLLAAAPVRRRAAVPADAPVSRGQDRDRQQLRREHAGSPGRARGGGAGRRPGPGPGSRFRRGARG